MLQAQPNVCKHSLSVYSSLLLWWVLCECDDGCWILYGWGEYRVVASYELLSSEVL